jgi:hypothetical protein
MITVISMEKITNMIIIMAMNIQRKTKKLMNINTITLMDIVMDTATVMVMDITVIVMKT